jgi:hypothetical protein
MRWKIRCTDPTHRAQLIEYKRGKHPGSFPSLFSASCLSNFAESLSDVVLTGFLLFGELYTLTSFYPISLRMSASNSCLLPISENRLTGNAHLIISMRSMGHPFREWRRILKRLRSGTIRSRPISTGRLLPWGANECRAPKRQDS